MHSSLFRSGHTLLVEILLEAGKHLSDLFRVTQIGHELAHVAQNATGVHRAPKDKQDNTGLNLPAIVKETLSKFTAYLPGYELIKIVLGRDPVTGQPVASSAEAIVKAIDGLIPGGAALYNELAQTKVVSEAFHWFSAEFKKLNITLPYVVGLLKQAYNEMGILKGKENIEILKRIFGGPLSRIKGFVYKSASKLKELALKGALHLIGGAAERVYGIINKGKATLGLILADPIGFANNLVRAVRGGLNRFVSNFFAHMKGAISGWIFGALANAGIQLPQSFDLKEVFFFVVQVLNVTYQYIRGKIVEKLGPNGEALMSKAEKGVEIIQRLVTEGPSALWSMLQEGLSNLKEMVFDTIIEWARNSIIIKAVTKLLSFFNPAGAIIQAGMAIYNTVMYFIERWNQIQEFASSVIDSVDNVARGNITSASAYIEKMMGRGLTLLISFLARIAGLGRISDGIRSAVDRVRKPIHKAIDKGIGFIIGKVKGFASKIKGKFSKKTEEQVQNLTPEMQENWHKGIAEIGDISEKSKAKPFTRKSLEGLLSSIKSRFRFRSIEVTPHGKDWNVRALMNPEEHILVHGDISAGDFKIGDLIQIYEGNWSIPMEITAIIDIGVKYKGTDRRGEPCSGTAPFSVYNERWKRYNPNETYKQGEAWAAIKDLPRWNNVKDARQTLNYRYHGEFHNPPRRQWHHIHEQANEGPHSVANLALTTAEFNQYLNHFYNQEQPTLTGRRYISLRNWLRENPDRHYEVGLEVIRSEGKKVLGKNFGRGPFQIIE